MIWVIGSNGMLARDIILMLEKKSISYIATNSEIDITSLKSLKKEALKIKPSYLINCAAYTKVDMAEDESDLAHKINADGVANITVIAKDYNAKLIHFSTDYVFDGLSQKPYSEDDKTNPINVYGKTKLEGEQNALILDNSLVFRVSWLYGINGANFVYTMLRLMNEKDSIKVVSDQYGSPTNTIDIANIVIDIIKNNSNISGLYNYTNDGAISWYDFALEIYKKGIEYKQINSECIINPCVTSEYPTKAIRPKYSLMSKEHIKRDLSIELVNWKTSLDIFFHTLINK